MDYTPVEPPFGADEALFDAPPGASWTRFPKRRQAHATESRVLRYRGLSFDLVTGAVLLQERQLRLSESERNLLSALIRRAGQIIRSSVLAEQLGVSVTELDAFARNLSVALVEAGAPCQPRRVEGLGYVLWR